MSNAAITNDGPGERASAHPPAPARKYLWRAALGVFLLSLIIRVSWVAYAHVTPISDAYGYDITAMHWLETGEYRYLAGELYAYRPPGYMAFLAAVYAVFGHNWVAAGIAQGVLGAMTSALLVVLAGRLIAVRVGAVAGLLHAFWPTAIAYVPVLLADNLVVFLLVVGLNCLVATADGKGVARILLASGAGLFYGAMFLARPSSVFFLPAWLGLAVYDPLGRLWRPRVLVLCVIGTSMLVTPWLVRNYRLGFGVGTFSTQGGYSLWWGNNWKQRDGGSGAPPRFPGDRELNEGVQNRFFRGKAIEWITHNPRRYAALCRTRLLRIFGTQNDMWAAKYFFPTEKNDELVAARYWKEGVPPETLEAARQLELRNRRLHEYFRMVAAPLMALGVLLALLRLRTYAYVLLPLACYVACHTLTVFAARYRVTSDPLIFVPLAALLVDLVCGSTLLCRRPGRWTKLGLAVVLVGLNVGFYVTGRDAGWYRLSPYPPPQCLWDESLGRMVELDLRNGDALRTFSSKACKLELAASQAGVRCRLESIEQPEGHVYGGVRIPVPGLAAARVELMFSRPKNIEAIFIDGIDAERQRRLRWIWRCDKSAWRPPADESVTCVVVPGQVSGRFQPLLEDTTSPINELRVLMRIKPGTHSSFTLRRAEVAVPPDQP